MTLRMGLYDFSHIAYPSASPYFVVALFLFVLQVVVGIWLALS